MPFKAQSASLRIGRALAARFSSPYTPWWRPSLAGQLSR
jgi:hypothetical protein